MCDRRECVPLVEARITFVVSDVVSFFPPASTAAALWVLPFAAVSRIRLLTVPKGVRFRRLHAAAAAAMPIIFLGFERARTADAKKSRNASETELISEELSRHVGHWIR